MQELPAADEQSTCRPWCAVENRKTGEVYLAGELERGIVPAQSVWTHGGGGGEDGCLLLLQKMNLELLRRFLIFCESVWHLAECLKAMFDAPVRSWNILMRRQYRAAVHPLFAVFLPCSAKKVVPPWQPTP